MKSCKMLIWCCLFLVAAVGCEKVPCYPPEHYAPEPGAPYKAEEVRIPTPKGYVLAGTLTLPLAKVPPYPAVLLITGSGHQDRDHLQSTQEPVSYYRPFRQIADALSRAGIAVLRMDDQGVGCSEGGPLENVTIQERADDNRFEIEYLRGRKDIEGHRIGLLGLSEGGNIGPMIAASDPSIRALVIMAGSASDGYKITEYQRRVKLCERSDLTDAQKESALAESMQGLHDALARGEGSRWYRSFLDYTPLPAAEKVSCPVLILHGDKDAHVPVDHARILAEAVRSSGNKDVTLKIFKDHNHLFLKDPDGRISGYAALLQHTNKLSKNVLDTISQWLKRRLAQD
ncbi:MAG: alpha/beta hydrolase [Desulfarculaceae bacterium]